MCGICGILNFDKGKYVSEDIIHRMGEVIEHRGPDDEGIFLEGNIGLGMRRLSIIDLAGGHQPIHNEDREIWIVFNGEIYNYLELKNLLEDRGHRFYTRSDTETIIHAYEEFQDECPKFLRGMFAFAIWDNRNKRLFLARDRVGKKPLYYTIGNDYLIFGSEIKSILQDERVRRDINLEALDSFLSLQYVPAPATIFKDIYKLPAGGSLTLTNERGSPSPIYEIESYWDLEFKDDSKYDYASYASTLRELLKEAVKIRLMSEVPLGAFLSGGIDSSTIVGLMSEVSSEPVKTFSVGFEEEGYSELEFARVIAKRFNTDHHEIIVKAEAAELLPKLIWHLDEPIADAAAIPTHLISEFARNHVTVVLTGEGADELFAGYRYYSWERLAKYYRLLPSSLREKLFSGIAKLITDLTGNDKPQLGIECASYPDEVRLASWNMVFNRSDKQLLYSPEVREHLKDNDPLEIFSKYYSRQNTDDILNRLLYVDTKVWLADDLMMKVDKMSMANSLEARTPFLDYKLMEFMASVPSSYKLRGNTSKYILKKVVSDLLPGDIIKRKKHSFDVPIGRWLREDLRDFVESNLSKSKIESDGYFNYNYLQRLWSEFLQGNSRHNRKIWCLLNFQMWLSTFLENGK